MARVYIVAVTLLAVGLFTLLFSQVSYPGAERLTLAAAFGALMLVASLYPLTFASGTKIAPKTTVTLDTSVIFASILLFQPGIAMLLAGFGKLLAQLIRKQRRYQAVFNGSQTALQAGVGGLILLISGWNVREFHFDRPYQILMIALAAAAMYLVNTLSVATIVGLRTGRPALLVWRQSTSLFEFEHLAQVALGLLAATVVDVHHWVLPLFLLPAFVIYRSLDRHVQIRRWAEEALCNSEASLAVAQRIAHLGSWEWETSRNEQRWSDEVFRILGYAPKEFAPTCERFLSCVHPDDKESIEKALQDAFQGKECRIDCRIRRRDGSERIVHVRSELVVDDAGKPIRVVGTLHDITETKRAEEQRVALLAQVEQALEFRNSFLSITSHELRSPVTLLKGYVELLHRRVRQEDGADDLQRPLLILARQVDRMTHLVDDLLDVSRIECGQIEFEMKPFHLNAALEEVIAEVSLSAADFVLKLDGPATDLYVSGDCRRIQQVMTNLLTNAVKYSNGSRRVEISIWREGDRAMISVIDHGIGIPAHQQPDLFKLYFRASNASKDDYAGLGLGLFISKSILERHEGTINVTSEEGKGTRVDFSLPALPAGQVPFTELIVAVSDGG